MIFQKCDQLLDQSNPLSRWCQQAERRIILSQSQISASHPHPSKRMVTKIWEETSLAEYLLKTILSTPPLFLCTSQALPTLNHTSHPTLTAIKPQERPWKMLFHSQVTITFRGNSLLVRPAMLGLTTRSKI